MHAINPPDSLLDCRGERSLLMMLENAGALYSFRIASTGVAHQLPTTFYALFGHPQHRVEPLNISSWIHPDDHQAFFDTLTQALEGHLPTTARFRFRIVNHGSTQTLYCVILIVPMLPATRTSLTNTAQLYVIPQQEKLHFSNSQLVSHKLASLGTLTAGITHDLNNIFTCVLACTDTLETLVTDAEARKYSQLITKGIQCGGELTDSILQVLRDEPAMGCTADPINCLQDLVKLLKHSVGDDVQLIVSLPNETLPVAIPPPHLTQVVLNLVLNARDALDGRGKIELISDYSPPDNPTFFTVTVKDNGPGMDVCQCQRIFDPFYSTKEPSEGLGLGLTIVKTLVETVQGSVTVESSPGRETLFTIALPLKQ